MMFPNAVGGHMPFVPTSKQKKDKLEKDRARQEKERTRHKSAPNKVTLDRNRKNTAHSMPALSKQNVRFAKPSFISEPDLQKHEACKQDKSFFSGLMNLFQKRKENKITLGSSPKNSPKGSPKDSPKSSPARTKHALPTPAEITIAKRQRTRTNSSLYSNFVMEAIEEIEEPYDGEDDCASTSSDEDSAEVQVVLSAVGIDIPRTRYLREDSLGGSLPGSSLE